jgi:spoIIIJ-associated protein
MQQNTKDNILELLSYLGISQDQVELLEDEATVTINLLIPEADAGIFIGHYAETLDGIQRIISAFINNGRDVHIPVVVDIADYRKRRLSKLESIAERLSQEVKQSGLPRSFPMGLSATERRQIHLLFADDQEFTTYSQGEGDGRRLYLALKSEFES